MSNKHMKLIERVGLNAWLAAVAYVILVVLPVIVISAGDFPRWIVLPILPLFAVAAVCLVIEINREGRT